MLQSHCQWFNDKYVNKYNLFIWVLFKKRTNPRTIVLYRGITKDGQNTDQNQVKQNKNITQVLDVF